MSPMSYDVGGRVQGVAATLTVAGLAVAVIASFVQPVYGLVAGGVGVLVAVAALLVKNPKAAPVARLGLGLVVGAALGYALTALGVLTPLGAAG